MSFTGLILLLITTYILLATGLLGEMPGMLIGRLSSTGESLISIRGFQTDIFWSTHADSVIVKSDNGEEIIISGAEIQSNLLDFILNQHIGQITVDELHIGLVQTDSILSLSKILTMIDMSIPASVDRLVLNYGIVTYTDELVLDSVYVDAAVFRDSDVRADVDMVRVVLPGFGEITGYGAFMLQDGTVHSSGFTCNSSPGSITAAGYLRSVDETLNITVSGNVNTAFLGGPVDLTVNLDGTVSGRLSDLQAGVSFYEGKALLFGEEAEFEMDTLMADLEGLVVRGFRLNSDNVFLSLSGSYGIAASEWDADVYLELSNADISGYLPSSPGTRLSGVVSASCSGEGYVDLNGNAQVDLTSSTFAALEVSSLSLAADLQQNHLDVRGSVQSVYGTITFDGQSVLGPDWVLETWSGWVDGSIASFSFLKDYGVYELPHVAGADFYVRGRGSGFGAYITGSTVINGLLFNDIVVDRTFIRGSLDISDRGMGFTGGIMANGISISGVHADTASLHGTFNMSGSDISVETSVSLDSLRVFSDAFQTSMDIELDGDDITLNNLVFAGSDNRSYSALAEVTLGDIIEFSISDISAAHSKLRIINDGCLLGALDGNTLILDTLWLDPPVGDFAMSGWFSDEDILLRAEVNDFDLTTFSTFSGLPAGMSGVGNFLVDFEKHSDNVRGSFTGRISDPVYGQFSMDSLTIDVSLDNSGLVVRGIYAWQAGVRSGFQMSATDIWSDSGIDLSAGDIDWIELEVNDIGDWLFYILPLPLRTMGASVSARAEYRRMDSGDYSFNLQASASIDRVYITILGMELPNVSFYLNYPDTTEQGYNTRLTLSAGNQTAGNVAFRWFANIHHIYPLETGAYSISAQLNEMKIPIPGAGTVIASGGVFASGPGMGERPLFNGKINIHEGVLGIPQPVVSSSSEDLGELPFDLEIDITSTGYLWFRSNFADVEMSLRMQIISLERKPTVSGYIESVRGRITLFQRYFDIIEGRVELIQGFPPELQLNVEAQTTVRSVMNGDSYTITILVTDTAENPEVTLTGEGPGGQLTQEDILMLLTVGLTYGEMQQINSSAALRTEVKSVGHTMLGNLLTRNLRHQIGLDTFEISRALFSDSTSLVLNVGKYVLPDLYFSYEGDVFSSDPGNFAVQYMFSRDFCIEASTRSSIHGDPAPTLEFLYTIRY